LIKYAYKNTQNGEKYFKNGIHDNSDKDGFPYNIIQIILIFKGLKLVSDEDKLVVVVPTILFGVHSRLHLIS